ncbi:hypothetical protein V5799_020621 [Amblyomma americanum]|uniref:Uncharacterized protein n=1 Tax=Amblyomma americanum TaxID=6943 RepID=A0AAQ4ETJ7_AMBAM
MSEAPPVPPVKKHGVQRATGRPMDKGAVVLAPLLVRAVAWTPAHHLHCTSRILRLRGCLKQSSAVSTGPDRPYLAPLDAFAWKPPPSTTSSITWPEATVFNLRHNVSSAGHDTELLHDVHPGIGLPGAVVLALSAGTRRGLDPCPSPTLHFPDSSAPWMPEQSSAVSTGPDRPYLANAFAWKPPPSTTSSITWPEATVFNLRHNVSSAGHDTDSCTMFTPVLAFQVLSYWLSAGTRRGLDPCPSPTLHFPDSSAPWMPEQSSAVSTGPDHPYLAPLDAFAWKPPPSTTSSITWPEATVFNLRHNVSSAGHDNRLLHDVHPGIGLLRCCRTGSLLVRAVAWTPAHHLHCTSRILRLRGCLKQSSAVSTGPDRPYLAPLDAFAWKPPPSTTSSITWPEATVFNLRHKRQLGGARHRLLHDVHTRYWPSRCCRTGSLLVRAVAWTPAHHLHCTSRILRLPWMPEQSSAVSTGPDRPYLAPLDAFAWKPPPSTTSSITWPEATVFNLRHNVSSAGHDTDSCTMFTPGIGLPGAVVLALCWYAPWPGPLPITYTALPGFFGPVDA